MKEYIKTIISGLKIHIKNSRGDWNQNDTTADSYIKNRTHWVEDKSISILPKTTINVQDLYTEHSLIKIKEGNTYTVIFNDERFVCKAFKKSPEDPACYLGDVNLMSGETENINEPFLIGSSEYYGYSMICTLTDGTHIIEVIQNTEVVHKLDKKYLPEMVSYGSEELESGVSRLPDGHVYLVLEDYHEEDNEENYEPES